MTVNNKRHIHDCQNGETHHVELTKEERESVAELHAVFAEQDKQRKDREDRRAKLLEKLAKHDDPILRELAEHLS